MYNKITFKLYHQDVKYSPYLYTVKQKFGITFFFCQINMWLR